MALYINIFVWRHLDDNLIRLGGGRGSLALPVKTLLIMMFKQTIHGNGSQSAHPILVMFNLSRKFVEYDVSISLSSAQLEAGAASNYI